MGAVDFERSGFARGGLGLADWRDCRTIGRCLEERVYLEGLLGLDLQEDTLNIFARIRALRSIHCC